MQHHTLSVIILNWNAAADTIRCVHDVARWQHLTPTLWVVDNGSTDDSITTITRECPDAHLLHNETNLGFAGGNNRGIIEALSQDADPLLLLNNDAHIEETDVEHLLATLHTNANIGFVGPLLFDADNKTHLLAAGGLDPVLHHHGHVLELPPGSPVRRVDYIPGTVLLVNPKIFQRVGLLDERYFFTMEVADLCMRARSRGYYSILDTQAQAFHALDRSSVFRESLYTYYIIRNRYLFIRKLHPHRKLSLFSFWTLYNLALIVKVRLNHKPATARAVWLGLRDGLRGQFGGRNELFLAPP